ncbi:MAG: DNA-processing protein DprA [Deltaproteobacteria bacterium]|nr:DNA-processing protein DprA [Deltaproteobacteria bacterium]
MKPTDQAENLNKIIALAASKLPLLKCKEYYALLSELGSPAAILGYRGALCAPLLVALESEEFRVRCEEEVLELQRRGIQILALGGDGYPALLSLIYQPPPVIYYRGSSEVFQSDKARIAMVGSRKADVFGCDLARSYAAYLASRGGVIVSGLALGVDAYSHRGALDSKREGSTIAVLGSGLDNLYPRQNERLAAQIIERGGAVVSQFAAHEKPFPSNFLDRNRVIAGLCKYTVVIQAPRRSGSLATARYALEEGREVLVVPGAVNDPRYEGSNLLIQQGANVVLNEKDLEECMPEGSSLQANEGKSAASEPLSEERRAIIELLRENVKLHYDQLSQSITSGGLAAEILSLELEGKVKRLPGNFLILSANGGH